MDVIVRDLTYVKVLGKWNYIRLILDLYNREIIGYSGGKNKNAELVYKAFLTIKYNLSKINISEEMNLKIRSQQINLLANIISF